MSTTHAERVFCPRCGSGYPISARHCPEDGAKLYTASIAARVGQQIENYNILEVLGEGAMAVVYRGEHVILGKPVAIKVLKEEHARSESTAERFLREARALGRIEYPNIVGVSDCGCTEDGTVFFVMEFLEGQSLRALLDLRGPLPLHKAVDIIRQVAGALNAAHDDGIVHRDLKPDNLMLTTRAGARHLLHHVDGELSLEQEGQYEFVKLLDFGVAKELDNPRAKDTEAGLVLGTPAYMAPEQAAGGTVDPRTDIYAVGAMFYELVTGEVPFVGDSMLEVLNGHIWGRVIPPEQRNPAADVSPAASRTILRCLEKQPDDRFQNTQELLEALRSCFTDRLPLRDAEHLLRLRGVVPSQSGRLTEELAELFAGVKPEGVNALAAQVRAGRRQRLTDELSELFRGLREDRRRR